MHAKIGRPGRKIAEYQRKTDTGCFLFASFLGWAEAKKEGPGMPAVAVILTSE